MKHIARKRLPEADLAVILRRKFEFERYGLGPWMSLDQAYVYYCKILDGDAYIVEYKPMSKKSFTKVMCDFQKVYDWLSKEKRREKRKGKWVWCTFYAVVNPVDVGDEKPPLLKRVAKLFNFNRREIHGYII